MKNICLEKLWEIKNFKPNKNQKEAILHKAGPLFLTAGPGSGKTRVLLWRVVNLIVFCNVKPEEIFLSTFTEKAALQLKNGLSALLSIVTNETNTPFDISKLSIGTIHSICRRLLTDRRFSPGSVRKTIPILLDELSQYFKVYNRTFWKELITAGNFADEESAQKEINKYFKGYESMSKHNAVTNCISLFNRFSEECIDPDKVKTIDPMVLPLLNMYKYYINSMQKGKNIREVDFSILQKVAFDTIESYSESSNVFKYIIIDEYQDTNSIQEKLFFALAKGHKNFCVVGDDDQALYRFRGATVENLVEFEDKCSSYLGIKPHRVDLSINYRSRNDIVDTYKSFINLINWKKDSPDKGYYRIADKQIKANRIDNGPAVVVSGVAKADNVYTEIADFILKLKETGKIQDYNQCAFLFPAMKGNTRVKGFKKAFEKIGINVYAPRSGIFLEVEEARAIWGLLLKIFDRPHYGNTTNQGLIKFRNWMIDCMQFATKLCDEDDFLKEYVKDRKAELSNILKDYKILLEFIDKNNWRLNDSYNLEKMKTKFTNLPGLSPKAKKNLTSTAFDKVIKKRINEGNPFTIAYIINSATSVDWSVLDLFYQLNAFKYFKNMYKLAETGEDEGPICNLSLITQYLSRFMEEYTPMITASFVNGEAFSRTFFASYTYAIYRLCETEFENKEDPFPKGRIPFLTIHQAKGLEFPVVVLGSVFKEAREADLKERIIRQLLNKEGEPLDKISLFDNMRMFYVGLSRAKNLLVLPRYTHAKNATTEFKKLFTERKLIEIKDFDLSALPEAVIEEEDLGKSYSYTGDYLLYQKCPRNYMMFKKYGFIPSRSQTMMFGNLVHQTIEDLHHFLIYERQKGVELL